MDSWIFADSLESGFKRIGFGWLFWTLAFQEFRISGFQDSWFPVFIEAAICTNCPTIKSVDQRMKALFQAKNCIKVQ
jgi:hypothetical protein